MTIQKRLWISNLILILITVILLIGVSLIITENFREFIGLPPPDNQKKPLVFNRALFRAERTIMNIIESEPDRFLNPDYTNQIDKFLNSLNTGLIVKKDNQIIYSSPFLAEIDNNYQHLLQQQINQETNMSSQKGGDIDRISDTLFMKIIPLHFSDHIPGTMFLINDATAIYQELRAFKNSVIYTLILFLIIMIIINTLITYLLAKQIVNPLIRLKNAAKQIQKGNYNFRLKASSKDEIGALFQSFEEARKQLQKSEETQKKYEQNRNELITNISHDLKTPITTIKGYIEGILDGVPKSKEKENKYLQTIYQNAVHMESLIEDLFLLSQFDLNQSPYHFEQINIKNYLADSYEELQFDLQEKGIQLELKVDYDEQKLVKADRQQLKRVILNIINNAINYRNTLNPKIEMILTEKEGTAQIEIKDNGRGIPKDILDKIFDRFYKEDRARSNSSPGSGLGLYIARKIIVEHGGNIWANSQVGCGTSIFFTLPQVKTNNVNKDENYEKDSNN